MTHIHVSPIYSDLFNVLNRLAKFGECAAKYCQLNLIIYFCIQRL